MKESILCLRNLGMGTGCITEEVFAVGYPSTPPYMSLSHRLKKKMSCLEGKERVLLLERRWGEIECKKINEEEVPFWHILAVNKSVMYRYATQESVSVVFVFDPMKIWCWMRLSEVKLSSEASRHPQNPEPKLRMSAGGFGSAVVISNINVTMATSRIYSLLSWMQTSVLKRGSSSVSTEKFVCKIK